MSSGNNTTVQKSKQEQASRISPTTVVYWSRLGLAVLAGVVYNALRLGQDVVSGTAFALGLGILFYAGSVFLVRNVLGYDSGVLKGPRKHVTLGMGSYIIWLIFTITLLNTILYPPPP